jgi:hypothetical protein
MDMHRHKVYCLCQLDKIYKNGNRKVSDRWMLQLLQVTNCKLPSGQQVEQECAF